MRDVVLGVAIVLGMFVAVWLLTQGLVPSLLAAGAVYGVLMHCPPFNLAAGLARRRRRDERERWVVVSRRTVFERGD